MKVAHISKSDRKGGGASKVAEYLTINQKNLGHQVDHFTAQETEGANSVYRGKKYLTHLRSKLTHYGYLDCFDIESFLFKKIVKQQGYPQRMRFQRRLNTIKNMHLLALYHSTIGMYSATNVRRNVHSVHP